MAPIWTGTVCSHRSRQDSLTLCFRSDCQKRQNSLLHGRQYGQDNGVLIDAYMYSSLKDNILWQKKAAHGEVLFLPPVLDLCSPSPVVILRVSVAVVSGPCMQNVPLPRDFHALSGSGLRPVRAGSGFVLLPIGGHCLEIFMPFVMLGALASVGAAAVCVAAARQ